MNRHHPYGYDSSPRRDGPPGPGPDRYHRYNDRGGPSRGRGRGRGRGSGGGGGTGGTGSGGYSSYDSSPNGYGSYDQGPPRGDIPSPYGYDSQDSYYSNPYSGGAPASDSFNSGYNQGYGGGGGSKFEDGPGSGYDEFGRARRTGRKDRDDKVHDSIIEERIQRERPCRTLFIRNVKYETSSHDVRRMFEDFGEIKTFFDLISTRGMVFVTYYDLRSAERARDKLQGSEISGRPIDVHYSLPRDDKGPDTERNVGALQVTIRNSLSGIINDDELRRRFSQYGDIKSIRPIGERMDSRYVEFYDTRAAEDAFERLRNQPLTDGIMDILLAWDNTETTPSNNNGPPARRDPDSYDDYAPRGGARGGRARGGFRGGRGRGGNRNYDDDYDRGHSNGAGPGYRGSRGGGRGGGGAGGGGSRYNDDFRGGDRYDRGPPPPPPQAVSSWGSNGPSYGGPGPSGYGQGPPPGPPPMSGPPPAGDDRLEQARRVQQLLAALKQPGASNTPPASAPPAPPAAASYPPPMPPVPPAQPYQYPPVPPVPQQTQPYTYPPPAAAAPAPVPQPLQTAGATAGNIPPNLMNLLQQMQHGQPQQAPQYGIPPSASQSSMGAASPPPMGGPPANNEAYSNLMSFLNQQVAAKRS